MRHLKNKKTNKEIENFKNKNLQKEKSVDEIPKSLKVVLLLSWIIPFIAMFIIHLSKMKLPVKTKEVVYKILNMNFTVILTQFVIVSIIQPLAYAKVPAIIIYALLAGIAGLSVYWIISHIIGTIKFLRNEDYSYKFSTNLLRP